MKTAVLAATLFVTLAGASAAHAEKWVYWAVPGGALAYDEESRNIHVASGAVAANVVTFFFVPQALGPNAFNILSERLQFDCRADRYRTLKMAAFNDAAPLAANEEPGDWSAIPTAGKANVFKRVFCTNARPPIAKDVSSEPALRAAFHSLPPSSSPPSTGAARLTAPAPAIQGPVKP